MRAVSVVVVLCGVQAGADDETGNFFNLKHISGPCVHPQGGFEVPTDDTDLVFFEECGPSLKKIQFQEDPCESGGFRLVHWSGEYVQPAGGGDMPDDRTRLKVHSDLHEDPVMCF